MNSTESTVFSLESILEDPTSELFKEFTNYLNQSYCIENLAFWLATQEYHEECENKEKQVRLLKSMINAYIKQNSPQEINIPCDMRQSILDDYNQGNYHLHIFDDAAEAVLELMRVNSFIPWISSCSLPLWSFETVMSSSFCSSTTSTSTKQYKSWPSPPHKQKKSYSTTSLTGLSSSFSFTDKWNLMKVKQQSTSRRSCSSLDYSSIAASLEDTIEDNTFSVPLAVTTSGTTTTRYRSMLKRVKKSLLGGNNINAADDDDDDDLFTPRSSFTANNESSSWPTSWRKSHK